MNSQGNGGPGGWGMQGGCGGNGGLTKVMAMDARLLALVETDTYGGRPGHGGNGGRGGSGVRLFFDSSVTHTHRQLIHNTNNRAPEVLEVEKEKERSGLRISEGRWVSR